MTEGPPAVPGDHGLAGRPAPAPVGAASPPGIEADPVTGAPRAGPRTWVPALQSLRGVAALWVVLYHLDVLLVTHDRPLIAIPGLDVGWLGVDLFFVLSAYLLGQPYMDGRARPLRQFWADRFMRIAPAYYAAAAIAALYWITLRRDAWDPWLASAALVFMNNVNIDTYYALNPAFWSLAVELQFYLLLPFVAPAFRSRWWPLALAVGVAVSVVVRALTFDCCGFGPFFYGTFGLPSFLGHFALGLVACRLRHVASPWFAAAAGALLVAVPTFLWITRDSVIFGFDSLAGHVLVRPIVAAGFALIILAAASPGALRAVLAWTPLRWLGDISYSLYLVHIPIQGFVAEWVDVATRPLAFVAWGTLASLVAGVVLYLAVERPAEQWRHRRKLRRRTAAAGVPLPT